MQLSLPQQFEAESILCLDYSEKKDREYNNSKLKASQGIGALFSPLIVSAGVSAGGYWFTFMMIAAILLILTPVIHYKLLHVKKTFIEENARL